MRNVILKVCNIIFGFIWCLCVSCLDSEFNLPFIIGIIVTSTWFIVFCWANDLFK